MPVLGFDSHYSLSTLKTVGTVNSKQAITVGLYIGMLLESGVEVGALTFEGYFEIVSRSLFSGTDGCALH